MGSVFGKKSAEAGKEISIMDLKSGDRAKLLGFADTQGQYRRKLLSMGLTRGVEIEFIQAAPMGDPVEIKVRGYSLSLRKDEAGVLRLEMVN